MGTAAAGLAIVVAACGGDDNSSPSTDGAPDTTDGGSPLASGDWSRVINAATGTLAMYTWVTITTLNWSVNKPKERWVYR